MKKGSVIIICALVIIIFTVGISYLCFKLYFKSEDKLVNKIEISLQDNGEGANIENLYPYTDEEAKNIKPYEFKIFNKSGELAKYQVLIEDVELKDKKGYGKNELLSRNQLRYELRLNGKIIQAATNMTNIKNNILDTRYISVGKTNKYELRVWIAENANNTNWMNKYYHYKVNIQSMTEEE